MQSSLVKKIYYHDTDAGGVVYYANYLKYLEEARTEFFAQRGIFLRELINSEIYFVVASLELEYKSPVYYGEEITVFTELKKIERVKLEFSHQIKKGQTLVLEGRITLVCINKEFKLQRIPQSLQDKLSSQ